MLALWLMVRESRLTDAVVDLLIETVHKIASRARRKVSLGLAREIERLLAEIAAAAIETPDGAVRAVIFPIVGEARLAAIVRSYDEKGALDRRIFETMRRSYARHYRRMLQPLLAVLGLRSNNAAWSYGRIWVTRPDQAAQ